MTRMYYAILMSVLCLPALACGWLPAPSSDSEQGGHTPLPSLPTDEIQRRVVHAALSLRGKPYSQGGNHPNDLIGPDGRPLPRIGPNSADCSGLVRYAYQQADITVGWVVSQQVRDGRPIPCQLSHVNGSATTCWQPGALGFLGTSHVFMYVGDGAFMDCRNWTENCVLDNTVQT